MGSNPIGGMDVFVSVMCCHVVCEGLTPRPELNPATGCGKYNRKVCNDKKTNKQTNTFTVTLLTVDSRLVLLLLQLLVQAQFVLQH